MSVVSNARSSVSSLLKRTRTAGSELRSGLESVRGRIRELKEQRDRIEAMPPAIEVAFQRVDEFVDRMKPPAGWGYPDPSRFLTGTGHYTPPGQNADELATLRFYLAPVLADMMKDAVEKAYADVDPISEDERRDQLEKVDNELLDAELAEESIVRAAEAAGFPMYRRHDADPRAVLAHDKALP